MKSPGLVYYYIDMHYYPARDKKTTTATAAAL
jgi:hypothetical protein